MQSDSSDLLLLLQNKYDLAAWVYLCDVSSAFGDKSPDYSPERLAFSLELMKKRRSFYKKVFAENFQNSIDKYGMKYMTRMVKDVMLATTGAEPTAIQMLEAKHHTYGIFGLEHDWISARLISQRRSWRNLFMTTRPTT